MGRPKRDDEPGALHHVFNRGLARRTIFETRKDKRNFLALLAKCVRRKEIRVHAFCLMTTHYHLLLESVEGELGEVMQYIQTGYSRYFNRSRKRDGPLMRGRYSSRRIRENGYCTAVLAYVAQNPVMAGMCSTPSEFEFCHAHPTWEGRRWFAGETGRRRGLSEAHHEVVAARLNGAAGSDPLGELGAQTPSSILSWMKRKAVLADGTGIGLPVCHFSDVTSAMEDDGLGILGKGELPRDEDRRRRMILSGLLRNLAGLRMKAIATLVERTPSTVSDMIRDHEARIRQDEAFAKLVAAIASAAILRGPFAQPPPHQPVS